LTIRKIFGGAILAASLAACTPAAVAPAPVIAPVRLDADKDQPLTISSNPYVSGSSETFEGHPGPANPPAFETAAPGSPYFPTRPGK
jgi:hypothetical protein